MPEQTDDTDLTLVLERQIAASPAAIWRCWTDDTLIKQWFAPKPVSVVSAKIDPVPGGIFNVVMQMPDHDPMEGPSGCVLLVEPHKRFVWTAALGPGFRPNPPHDSPDDFYNTVDITLTATESGTRYVVKALHATTAHKAAHEAMGFHTGWGTMTDQLAAMAATL
ncbi:SRPBCC domain-containing protein [Yoonia sp. 208BN28-4]|uniref:SRPBCC domain-containing protein n=1 Tax=Yoonia sp. 208BN28-4 TaxID=3126505 RepID=UPI0030994DD2